MNKAEHIAQIKLERQQYNAAISSRNVDAICTFLTADYHVLTSAGTQSHGVEDQRRRWAVSFQADPIVLYRRRTRELRLNKPLDVAEELGNWAGKFTLNKQIVLVAGVYSAKWQRQQNGFWLIQSEVFTTLRSINNPLTMTHG